MKNTDSQLYWDFYNIYNIYPGLATGVGSCATAGSAATTTAPCPPAGCHGPAETQSRESRAQPRQMTGYFNK